MASFNYAAAIQSGASPDQINQFLSTRPDLQVVGMPQPQAQMPTEMPQQNPSVGGFVQNAGNDVSGILQGLLHLPQVLSQLGGEAASNIRANPLASILGPGFVAAQTKTGKAVAGGVGNEAKRVISNPVKALYDKPVSTALDVLPFLDAAKGASVAGEAGDVANTAEKSGNILTKAADAIKPSETSVTLPGELFGAAKEDFVNSTLKKYTTPGASPEQMYQQIGPAAKNLYDKVINPELENNPKMVNASTIKQNFADELSQNAGLGVTMKKATDLVRTFFSDQFGGADSVSTPKLFDLKQRLNGGMGLITKKIANGSELTDMQKVTLSARDALDKIITQEHPNIKEATLEYGALKDAADPLSQMRTPAVNPLEPKGLAAGALGAVLGGGPGAALGYGLEKAVTSNPGRTAISNVLNGVGNLASNVPSGPGVVPTLGGIINPGAIAGNSLPPQGISQNGEQPQNQSNNGQNVQQNIPSNTSISQGNNGIQQITSQDVATAYQIAPKVIADRIKAAYDAQQLGQGPRTAQDTINKALTVLPDAKNTGAKHILQDQASSGPLGQLGLLQPDEKTTQLDAYLGTLKSQVLAELSKRGISSPEAVKQLDIMIPTGSDNPTAIKQKLDALPKSLQVFFQSVGINGATVGGQ